MRASSVLLDSEQIALVLGVTAQHGADLHLARQ